jgi:8-oxo-dGTP diphosphatase
LENQGKVLLSLRSMPPWKGKWDLIGGFCEANEHPTETARREAREETGLTVITAQLLGIWMDLYDTEAGIISTMNLYYFSTVAGGSLKASHESFRLAWFDKSSLPFDELAFPNHLPDALARWNL